VTFTNPAALLLLVLAVPIALWARGSFSHQSRIQRAVSLALRLAILVMLVLALAGARAMRKVDRLGVVFVVDSSDSIPAAQRDEALATVAETIKNKPKDDLVGLVMVGREGAIDTFPTGAIQPEEILRPQVRVSGNYTNLADGIRLAFSSFPPGVQKRIVLLTDGAENLGDAVSEATRVVGEGAEIVTVPIRPEFGAEAGVDMLYAPGSVGEGETVGIRMIFSSSVTQKGRVILMTDGQYTGESEIELTPGKNTFSFPQPGLSPGFHSFAVALEAERDTMPENNRAFAYTRVAGRAGVLIASNDASDTGALDRALSAHRIESQRMTSRGLPLDLAEWLSFDSIVLSAVPAHELSEPQMQQIAASVKDFGHGLAMLGDPDSFGPGGYYKTKIEEALPVTMDFKKHALSPNVAVCLLIDRSGSMSMVYNGYEKLALAREACIATIEVTEPSDYIGVLTFDSLPMWVLKFAQNTDKEKSKEIIRSVQSGGGTEIYPALVEAEKKLSAIDAKVKHVILLSDGMTAPGDFSAIVGKLVAGNVTVSTVSIGDDADLKFMADIAKAGKGNAYFTDDPYDLPRIFTRETFMANKGTIVETPFKAVPSGFHSLTSGIAWESAPQLDGYVATSAKPTAEVPLRTPQSDPLLAAWRYGLGMSVAWTSDAKNRWGAHWLGWEGYESFFSGILRATSAAAQNPGYRAEAKLEGDRGIITLTALEERAAAELPTDVEANVVGPDMKSQTVKLRQVASGKYSGEFPIENTGTYMVNVIGKTKDGARSASTGLAVSYSPEYRRLGPDEYVLGRLAALGTELSLSPDDLFNKGRKPQVKHDPIWELLILIAVYLWILDIAVRRVSWSREYLEMAEEAFRSYSERLRQARIRRGALRENVSIARLVERSKKVRELIGVSKPHPGESAPTAVERIVRTRGEGGASAPEAEGGSPAAVEDSQIPEITWHKPVDDEGEFSRASYEVRARKKLSGLRRRGDKKD
jgi:hypothetical protein